MPRDASVGGVANVAVDWGNNRGMGRRRLVLKAVS